MRYLVFLALFLVGVRFCVAEEVVDARYVLANYKNQSNVDQLWIKDGPNPLIEFTKESDPEALFVLRKLTALEGLRGQNRPKRLRNVPVHQALLVSGTLGPPGTDHFAPRTFTLRSLHVQFPLNRKVRWEESFLGVVETHFSLESLFPQGLSREGRSIDLQQFERGAARLDPKDVNQAQ